MDDTPLDIMKSAHAIAGAFQAEGSPDYYPLYVEIARALTAERERCAKVADDAADWWSNQSPTGNACQGQSYRISKAIRNGDGE